MFEFRLPDVGEGVAEGEIVAWHVASGDEVAADEVIVEVETDKAVVDLPSPIAGTIAERHATVGEVVPVGEVLVSIQPADEAAVEDTEPAPAESQDAEDPPTDVSAGGATDRVFAPPHVRRLARELDVDIGTIQGSGPGGRISEGDVRAAAEPAASPDDGVASTSSTEGTKTGHPTATSAAHSVDEKAKHTGPESADRDRTLAAPATRRLADELGVDIDAVPTEQSRDGEAFVTPEDIERYADAQSAAQPTGTDQRGKQGPADDDRESREPYRGIRRTIGEQMVESASSAPHVTHHDTAVVTSLVEAREAMQPRAEGRGISLTFVPFVLKAVVAGLREYPVLNSTLETDTDEIVYKHYYDIGVATATDAGLMVPVVRDVDEKGLFELASEVTELAARARDRSITREEMQGGTFTITNFGAIGGEYATPIINHPETAILGLGAIEERPAVVDGDLEARHTLPLSLSIDHRVIDGAEAASFVNHVIEYLETPSLLLLDDP